MNPDDPRSVRTDDALSAAIRRLATRKPVEELSVNEVCSESGVSRATFYRRARTPGELLATEFENTLRTAFDAHQEQHDRAAQGAELLASHRSMLNWLTNHIEQNAAIYRHSFGVDHSVLALVMRNELMQKLRHYLDNRRDQIVLPMALRDQPWPVTREILSRNYADGEIGLFKVWLDMPRNERDRATLAEWMLALTPSWNRRLMDMGGGRV